MIRDRGIIKWTAIMIPELVKEIKEYYSNDDLMDKPILDEYEIQSIEEKIHFSIESGDSLTFKWWRDGFVGTVTGHIQKIDPVTKELYIVEEDGSKVRIMFNELTEVK